jgi:hypothetical protein
VVGKSVHTNIKQTAPGKPFTLQHLLFGDFAIVFFLFFYNVVLRVRRAASTDLRQACEYRFTE